MAPLFWTLEEVPRAETTSTSPPAPAPAAVDRCEDSEDRDDDDAAEVAAAAPGPGLASRVLQYAGQLWTEQGVGLGRSVGRQVGVVLSQAPALAPPPAVDALRRVARALKEKQD